ncbi:hypothetical protein [Colwellia piezophila]|uniref:hypothetical protein n=1 Tax=Colwellia piezophila TaxID=211668 RepID=UPI00036DABF3|nr:hypothetical protein [Colwellia piezophila]
MIKYLLCFCIGAGSGYFISTLNSSTAISAEQETAVSPTALASSLIFESSNKISDKDSLTLAKVANNADITVKQSPRSNLSRSEVKQIPSPDSNNFREQIKELTLKNKALEDKYRRTNNRVTQLTLEIESLDESDITDQQMMALITDDFAKYRRGFRGNQRDEIYQLHQEEEDLDWGYKIATQLTDFIQTHYHANSLILQGVTCKIDRCELLISETEAGVWSLVVKEMAQQTWWQFTSIHSSSSSADDEQKSFYLLMSS